MDSSGRACGILALGSRIFSDGRDPKSKQSLAVDRRDARAMRRRRDRYLQRRRALVKHLTSDGLFPADEAARKALAARDPYELRARALDEKLEPGEIARAIFHLNQRRGFQSNRKADRKSKDGKDEAGKVDTGIRTLKGEIAAAEERADAEPGSWTFGKWLHERRAGARDQNTIPFVRTRMRAEPGEDKNDIYHFYPGRDIVKREFDAIWEAQREHHPDLLTQEVHDRLYEIVFHQRPLKEPKIGQCTLVPGEERLPKRHPLFQRRRLLEELNALMIVRPGENPERLMPEQRDLLLKLPPNASRKLTFSAMRKALRIDATFNKESDNRDAILGDEVVAVMASKKRFGSRWATMPLDEQLDVIERIDAVESEMHLAALHAWLRDRYGVDDATARAIADAPLPEGFGRFGITATTGLIAALMDGRTPAGRLPAAPPIEPGRVVVYSEAADIAGYHHSDNRTGEVFADEDGTAALPYYGRALERHIMPGSGDPEDADAERWGRITNPTVHIGLGQLRRVVNALIRTYGKPAEIALELARELKLSEDEKKTRNLENARNRAEAQRRSRALTGEDADGNLVGEAIAADTGANRARVKLWEELDPNVLNRCCPYTGVRIGIEMLFSNEVEIDHILPFDATLDDSAANKTVCLTAANREKGKASPFQKWGYTDRWPEIAERAARMPRNKRWRFEPDAMDRFKEEGGFLARHLVDTQYLGRLAREYVETLYPEQGPDTKHVWVSPGRLTEMVRRKLNLNAMLGDDNIAGSTEKPKNRLDHRHHTIDAFVVGIVDRSMLQRIATASGQTGQDGAERIEITEPWPGARDELFAALRGVTVSHRPDHGTIRRPGTRDKAGRVLGDQTAGRLHNDTAYGFTGERDAKGNTVVVRRVPLSSIVDAGRIAQVRDPVLRAELAEYTQGFTGKAFDALIADFPRLGPLVYRGIRRVRITEALSVIPIRDAGGRAFKGYKGDSNYRYDVWETPDGKWTTRWTDRDGIERSSIVSMFEAHQDRPEVRPHPAARKVVSLHQGDVVAIEPPGGEPRLGRVVKFGADGRLYLAALKEGGALKARDADKGDPFAYDSLFPAKQKAWRMRAVRVDELGRVRDPGFGRRKPPRPTRHDPAQPSLAAE